MSNTPPKRSPPSKGEHGTDAPTNVERAHALRDVMVQAVKVEREYAKPYVLGGRRSTLTVIVLCIALLVLSGYSLVVKPEFIWGPRTHAAITPERTEASVRFMMSLLARSAEAHRTREGEYPASGREIGADSTFVYTRVGPSQYTIVATVGGKRITLSSTDDLGAFLGNSGELIQQRVPR